MKTLAEMSATGLKWVQRKGAYVLMDADETILGQLRRPRWFSAKTEVDAQGNRWTFEKKGLRHPYIEIRSLGTGEEPARFEYHGQDGDLIYPDGRVYHWRSVNWNGRTWLWADEDDQPLLGIQLAGGWTMRGEIRIDPEFTSDKAPSLLLFLGWFLVSTYYEESAAIIAATTATMG